MAKTKKPETTDAGKKKASKAKPAAATTAPMIDTNLAAESAAKMVSAKVAAPPSLGGTSSPASKESSAFKQMKEGLNKPASGAMTSFLDKTAGPGQKKPNLPYHGGKQVGRNQTFGADVNRSGVPRRTGG